MDSNLLKILTLCFDKAPEEAVKFMESKGIKCSWGWREQLEIIKIHAFTVAKLTSADMLSDLREALDKAMDDGQSYAEFKKNAKDLLETKGYYTREDGSAWRLETIYRTNMQSAYMAGRYHQMVDVADSFPYWEMISIIDIKTSDTCKGINGIIRPANDEFWKTNYPPRHYRCRSRVRNLSDALMKQRNSSVTDPATVQGIKPAEGFETYPGEWKPDLSKYDPDIKSELKKMKVHA